MPAPYPTTTVSLQDGSRSGHFYSPANGSSAQPAGVSVPLTMPAGWGVVGVSGVYLNANSTYTGPTPAAYIDVTLIRSGGNIYIGQGSVEGDGANTGNFVTNAGLRWTGVTYNRNDGVQPPLLDVGAVYYQITMGGDASAVILPFQSGISVQIDVVIARFPRRVMQVI